MDPVQSTSVSPQPTAVNPQPSSEPAAAGATGAAAHDEATQLPVTFKALLAQLKTLKQGSADAALPEPTDTLSEEPQASDAIESGLGIAAAIAGTVVPLPFLPIAPVTGADTQGQAQDAASVIAAVINAPRGEAGAPDAYALKRDADASLLAAAGKLQLPKTDAPPVADPDVPLPMLAPAAGTAVDAADFAVRGDYLPSNADASRAHAGDAALDLQSTLQVTAPHAAAPSKVAAPPAMAAAQISTPLGTANWGNEVGQHMVWMVGQKQHVAELHLNPPHLGPLDITLTIDDKQTTAVFTSPHGAVRDAITAELPRLREVLAESGITLGNASVTADTPRDGSAFASHQFQRGQSAAPGAATDMHAAPLPAAVQRRGMVDLFA